MAQSHTPHDRCPRFGPHVTITPARLAPSRPATALAGQDLHPQDIAGFAQRINNLKIISDRGILDCHATGIFGCHYQASAAGRGKQLSKARWVECRAAHRTASGEWRCLRSITLL